MIPFIDLKAQKKRLGDAVDRAIARVAEHGAFIMGPEVAQLEEKLARFCGAKHAISCSSGTDALSLALMAKGTGANDAVFVPAFTFVATAEAVVLTGATPVFVDVLPDTFNMDPASLKQAITVANKQGLSPKAVIPVDLFGLPADYDALQKIADEHDLWVLGDAAQSFGAAYNNKRTGTLADITATSFFPAKPLGCWGDGGAVFTEDAKLAELMQSIRVHGKGSDKYDNVRIGLNARLDTVQAAVLIEKLAIYDEEIKARQQAAQYYNANLKDTVQVPVISPDVQSAWAQYTVVLDENCDRDAVASRMKTAGVPTAVYYPTPLHRQSAYAQYPKASAALPVSENLSKRVLSLPMHAYLDRATQDKIIAALKDAVAQKVLRNAS